MDETTERFVVECLMASNDRTIAEANGSYEVTLWAVRDTTVNPEEGQEFVSAWVDLEDAQEDARTKNVLTEAAYR